MLRFSSLASPRARPASVTSPLLNLGCGRRRHPGWTNADLVPDAGDVLRVDLRRPLPFADGTFTAVYASHVLEHLAPADAAGLIREIARVLVSGGIVRIVVPDLEGIVRAYLASLDAVDATGDDESRWWHRWMTVELLDQLVRRRSGGLMRRWWSSDPVPCRSRIEDRLGAEAAAAIAGLAAERVATGHTTVDHEAILVDEPVSDRDAARFASRGERHQWMYDRVSLAERLRAAGFVDSKRVAAQESSIPGYARYELDADAAGRPHKPDSLFMEAIRA